MKKLISFLTAAVMLLGMGAMTACSDDDESTPGSIIGTWQAYDVETIYTFTFGADGSYQEQYSYYDSDEVYYDYGTYTYDGENLIVTYDSGSTATLKARVSGDKLYISNPQVSMTITLTRVS